LLDDEPMKGESQHTDWRWFIILKIYFTNNFKMV